MPSLETHCPRNPPSQGEVLPAFVFCMLQSGELMAPADTSEKEMQESISEFHFPWASATLSGADHNPAHLPRRCDLRPASVGNGSQGSE